MTSALTAIILGSAVRYAASSAMADDRSQELGALAKVVIAIAIVLIVAGVLWPQHTGDDQYNGDGDDHLGQCAQFLRTVISHCAARCVSDGGAQDNCCQSRGHGCLSGQR